jgi:hypothetical protein
MLMKKITLLTMLLALFGMVAFAQKDMKTPLESAKSPSTPFTGKPWQALTLQRVSIKKR